MADPGVDGQQSDLSYDNIWCKNLRVTGTMSIDGSMTFGDASTDTLTVNGAATFASTVAVTGVTTLTGGASIGAAANLILTPVVKAADEDVDGDKFCHIDLDGTSANVQLTNLVAAAGQMLVITCSDSTNTTTVKTKSGTTFDGTNNTATFDAAGETLVLFGISATQFVIVENIGSVTLSST